MQVQGSMQLAICQAIHQITKVEQAVQIRCLYGTRQAQLQTLGMSQPNVAQSLYSTEEAGAQYAVLERLSLAKTWPLPVLTVVTSLTGSEEFLRS